MGKTTAFLKHMTATQPVLVVCAIMCTVGVALPAIVPPIRNALSKSDQPPPPNLKEVVSGMTGKSTS